MTDRLSRWRVRAGRRPQVGRATARALGMVALPLVLATLGATQRRRDAPPSDADFKVNNVTYDGTFTFVRFRYTPARIGWGGGGGYFGGVNYSWDHDYPRAEQHLSLILRELTMVRPNAKGTNILGADDPELFKFPFAYVSEPGFWTLTDEEATTLRAYLLKGGVMILDDFLQWDWPSAEAAIHRILPDARPMLLDVTHPLFDSFFAIESLEMVHPYRGVPSAFLGVFENNDPDGRLLMIINLNNDIGESWEYSNTGFIPIELSNEAFKLGVNYIVYAMTH